MADKNKPVDLTAETPSEPPAAAGGDVDSRRRELKATLAMAETRGDTDAVDRLRKELASLTAPADGDDAEEKATAKRTRASAAAERKAAADKSGDGAQTAAPTGRTAPANDGTTAAQTPAVTADGAQ
jgi:hypothetical protein